MKQEIIDAIKSQYSRDLRKQMVRNILKNEQNSDKEALEASSKILSQIFSYVISELQWEIAEHTAKWDETPLEIMKQAFPKIETTKWFDEQQLKIPNTTKQNS